MPFFNVTITGKVTKDMWVEADDSDDAVEKAHSEFTVACDGGKERYNEDTDKVVEVSEAEYKAATQALEVVEDSRECVYIFDRQLPPPNFHGIFVATAAQVAAVVGREHPGMELTLEEDDFSVLTSDPEAVEAFKKFGFSHGLDPVSDIAERDAFDPPCLDVDPSPLVDWDPEQADREGWGVMDVDSTGWLEIERIDEADTFETDEDAENFVIRHANAGSAYHAEALRLCREAQAKFKDGRPRLASSDDEEEGK